MITEKYAIVPDLPNTLDIPGAIKFQRFIFHFDKDLPARYGVFRRDAENSDGMKWFDVEGHYVFHFGNSWDSTNEQGQDIVTFFGVVWPHVDMGMQEHIIKRG